MPDPHVRVLNEPVRITYAVGGTPTDTFEIPFTFYENGNVKVYNVDALISDTDYTVTGNPGRQDGFEGGSLVLDTPVTNTTITVLLDITVERTTDFPNSSDFRISSLNTQLDKCFSILQQFGENLSRAASLKKTSLLQSLVFAEDPQDGRFSIYSEADGGFVNGANVAEIENAQGYAEDAAQALAETEVAKAGAEAARDQAVAAAAALPLNNYIATTNPTVNDDSGDGYSVGSKWVNTVSTEAYTCLNSSLGAAVWEQSTLTIDDLGSAATQPIAAFATAAQGAKADSALQPGGSGAGLSGILKSTMGTPVTASGSAIDFTGLPAGVREIIIAISGLSLSGTQPLEFQIGDSGGIENTGYVGGGASGATFAGSTSGFAMRNNGAGNAYNGCITLTLLDATTNTWSASGNFASASEMYPVAGAKSLTAVLDRVRISAGSDTFDAGKVNITYKVQT